jgi:hypothetical protein
MMAGCRQPAPTTQRQTPSQDTAPAATPAATAVVPAAPRTTSLSSDRLNSVVDALLRTQYPEGFDDKHDCWKARYGEGDEAMAYCMHLLPASAVSEAGQQVVYVATASAANIEDDPSYGYGATDPGMFDAFRVVVAPDGATTLTASGKGLDFGMAGDCGCADADLVALGPDVHGWVFSSGGTQQGITTATHSLVAPVGDTFRDVGGIPHYVEDQQDVEYRLAIASDDAVDGWFPLTISKYRGDDKIASRVVHFDRSAQRYLPPQAF